MAKKPISVPGSRLQKRKPTKHISKRRKLKSALRKIFNYIKSDSYMFAPFIHPQSSPPLSSEGEVSFELVKKKEKKLVEEVDDYLKCDTYMYAPLVEVEEIGPSSGDESRGNAGDQMERRSEQAGGDDEHTLISPRDVEVDDRHNPTRRIVLEQIAWHKERVKNTVHQNCGSLSTSGKVISEKKPRKVLVE